MAETAATVASPPPDPTKPVGGGGAVSGRRRGVESLDACMIKHLDKIYKEHAGSGGAWSAEQASAFFSGVQHGDKAVGTGGQVDFHAFLEYMASPDCDVATPAEEQDLSYPLSSYFISSSHNTYLTGNQLSSDSSTEAYKDVLLRGCRCIEIDVWDGEDPESGVSGSESDKGAKLSKTRTRVKELRDKLPATLASRLEKTSLGKRVDKFVSGNGGSATKGAAATSAAKPSQLKPTTPVEPRVLHGHTLTKEISFRAVCETIRDNAFVTTDLPIIVSLEVHCHPEQQQMMVDIMEQVWKDRLLPEPKNDPQLPKMPSPDDLRGKVLIKVKYVKPEDAQTQKPSGAAPESEGQAKKAMEEHEHDTKLPAALSGTAVQKKKQKPAKIIQTLSQLGIYTRGVSFKSITQPEATMPGHVFSVSESGILEVHAREPAGLFRHNRHFLMRAYPSAMRFLSSNLDPLPYWRKGVQMVALNWQSWDEGMMLNEGMFAGSKGYVLKPEGYRAAKPLGTPSPQPDAADTVPAAPKQTLTLTIAVLAAQKLRPVRRDADAEAKFRPYVRVDLHVEDRAALPAGTDQSAVLEVGGTAAPMLDRGEKEQEKEGLFKLRTRAAGHGCAPDFGGEELRFRLVAGAPAPLIFVRFIVRDSELMRDALAGWACVRLDRLRQGYRFVHLLDDRGQQTEGALLVKVTKTLE